MYISGGVHNGCSTPICDIGANAQGVQGLLYQHLNIIMKAIDVHTYRISQLVTFYGLWVAQHY